MLTCDVKVNGVLIATITARNTGRIPGIPKYEDRLGDFVDELHQPRRYTVSITEKGKIGETFTVDHDRFYGWAGLLHKITDARSRWSVETVYADEA